MKNHKIEELRTFYLRHNSDLTLKDLLLFKDHKNDKCDLDDNESVKLDIYQGIPLCKNCFNQLVDQCIHDISNQIDELNKKLHELEKLQII